MFDYTRGVLADTVDSIKRLTRAIDIIAQIVYIIYLIVSIATGKSFLAANCVLLAISIAYFIYFLSTIKRWYTKQEKARRKKVKNILWYSKKLVHIVVIVLAIVDLSLAEEVDSFSILSVVFMVLGFLIPSLLKIITNIIEKRIDLFIAAIKRDTPKPLVKVVKKMTRSDDDDEVEDDDDLQAQLDRICIEQKEMRERKRAWKNSIRMNKVTK